MCMGSVDSCSNLYGILVDVDDDDLFLQSEQFLNVILVFQFFKDML